MAQADTNRELALEEEIQAQLRIQAWLKNFGISSRHEGAYMDFWRCKRRGSANVFALSDVLDKIIEDGRAVGDIADEPTVLYISVVPEETGETEPKACWPSWATHAAMFVLGMVFMMFLLLAGRGN